MEIDVLTDSFDIWSQFCSTTKKKEKEKDKKLQRKKSEKELSRFCFAFFRFIAWDLECALVKENQTSIFIYDNLDSVAPARIKEREKDEKLQRKKSKLLPRILSVFRLIGRYSNFDLVMQIDVIMETSIFLYDTFNFTTPILS